MINGGGVNDLEILNFHGSDVRVVLMDGEPWWVLRDVCAVLDIKNPSDAVTRLDADGVGQTEVIDSLGRKQQATIVSEPALYELVIRSDKPKAVDFRRWVTHKVKDLRKTGVATVRDMSPAEILVAQAQRLLENERRLAATEARATVHEARIEALEGNFGRVTALAYAKLNSLPDSVEYLNRLGRLAGQVARAEGVPAEKAHSTIFGTVNTWPVEIWDEAVRRLDE